MKKISHIRNETGSKQAYGSKNLLFVLRAGLFLLFVLTVSIFPCFTQEAIYNLRNSGFSEKQHWWLSLELGKQNFRNGNYGDAMMNFEDARRYKRSMYEQMETDFINFLSLRDVRMFKDRLDFAERYAKEKYYLAISSALEELYYHVPKASFKNSSNAALKAIGKLKNYPEAEYWIGEVYRLEGESALALGQFQKVLSMSNIFEYPEFKTELQYKIAALHYTRQEYNEMENIYLSIINELDTLWINSNAAELKQLQSSNNGKKEPPIPYAQASASFATQSMIRTLENEGINRFLEIYRYDNQIVENAHRQLGFFYTITGRRLAAQQHLMFSFLIQNTIIINEITSKQFNFTFNNINSLLENSLKNKLVLSYIDEVEYYKTIYLFGVSYYEKSVSTARNFWSLLSSRREAGEWQARSINQLRSPYREPVIEMP